jgi:small-conductance mechanosensitive channel
VASQFNHPWIPADRIDDVIQLEPALLVIALALGAWLFHKIFLRKASESRRKSISRQTLRLFGYSALFAGIFGGYWFLHSREHSPELVVRFLPYIGLGVIVLGGVIFVRSTALLLLEYLFFRSPHAGVPIVVVNTFSLILYAVVFGGISKTLFNLQVSSVLATSAIFSILLGLALQDTLGNLFSGIALQMDKPFDLGDWVEITANSQKWSGKVHEISWRATSIIGLTDELISIPNRVISQGLVANFSMMGRPILRRYIIKVPYGTSIERAKQCLIRAAYSVPKILKYPEPILHLDETSEHWIPIKLLYYIENYGDQWEILDQVMTRSIEQLQNAGIEIAPMRLKIEQDLADLSGVQPPAPPSGSS